MIRKQEMNLMSVMNITSTIKPEKTIMEIENILVRFGAKGIMKEYENNRVSSIAFYIEYKGQQLPFKLPMNIQQARSVIEKAVNEKKLPYRFKSEPHRTDKAEIVGWRIIKDWIHAQLSLLEVNFADPLEILLPYVYDTQTKKTFFEKVMENPNMLITYQQDGDELNRDNNEEKVKDRK